MVSPPERRSAPPVAVGEGKRRSDARGLAGERALSKGEGGRFFPVSLFFTLFRTLFVGNVVAQKCITVRNHVSPLCSGQKNILCNEQVYVGQTPVQLLLLHFDENLLLPFLRKKEVAKTVYVPVKKNPSAAAEAIKSTEGAFPKKKDFEESLKMAFGKGINPFSATAAE